MLLLAGHSVTTVPISARWDRITPAVSLAPVRCPLSAVRCPSPTQQGLRADKLDLSLLIGHSKLLPHSQSSLLTKHRPPGAGVEDPHSLTSSHIHPRYSAATSAPSGATSPHYRPSTRSGTTGPRRPPSCPTCSPTSPAQAARPAARTCSRWDPPPRRRSSL